MLSFIFGVIFAGITLLAIGLQRTYNHFPVKELKRQARAGDPLAGMLYKPVSYGASLNILLWTIVVVSAALSFVLLSRALEAWFAVIVVAFLIWTGFLWLPSGRLTAISTSLARLATPGVNWVLSLCYPLLQRLYGFFRRYRHFNVHTGLYEKEDLVDLLEDQRTLPDNRIPLDEIDMLIHALSFGDKLVRDVMVPLRAVQVASEDEAIGPKLMDELYQSGHSRFPVYSGEKTNIVGTLFMRDLVKMQHTGKVSAIMHKDIFYVHEDFTLFQALQAFLKTKHHLFIVVNSFEEFVGILTIEDVLEQVIGKPILDEFDKYDSLRAVAAAMAEKEHLERQKDAVEPADGQPDLEVIE